MDACFNSWDANKHMEFSGSMQLCGNGLLVTPRGSFPADFHLLLIGFLPLEIQSAIDRSLPTPTQPHRVLETNEFMRSFCYNSWICFINRPCLKFGMCPVSIACLQSEIDTSKIANQQIHFTEWVPFHV